MATDCFLQQTPPKSCALFLLAGWVAILCPLAWLRAQVGLRDWAPHRDVVSHDRLWEHLLVELWRRNQPSEGVPACLPACLPAYLTFCLQKSSEKWRPDANPAWIGALLLPAAQRGGLGPACSTEGTWGPFVIPQCSQTGK